MAKKSQISPLYGTLGIVAALVLSIGGYVVGTQHASSTQTETQVLGSSSSNTPAGQVASAAYAKCISNGGFVTTNRRPSNGFYNICNFADDMNCELYALYNGQCPVGGVKTIGYSTTDQVYCALRGGTPQGKNNGQCKMPDGKVCSTSSVFNGTCDPN